MGFRQTETHRNGKGSYHQIGLVRGQFGDPGGQFLDLLRADVLARKIDMLV